MLGGNILFSPEAPDAGRQQPEKLANVPGGWDRERIEKALPYTWGATASFNLGLVASSAPSTCGWQALEKKTMTLEGRRILLVEDEYFIVQDLARAFTAAGAVVVGPSATIADALRQIAATQKLDGAVLDINLQGEMVYPVADALATRGVPFVFTTGYDQGSIPDRFAGRIRCEKPVKPDQVATALFG